MKHKWLVAVILIAVEIVIGALIVESLTTPITQSGFKFRFFQFDVIPAESDEELHIPVGNTTHLSVSNLRGQIAIAGAPGDAIVIHAHKQAWSNTAANAQAALAALQVNVAQMEDTIQVTRVPTEELFEPGIVSYKRSPTVALTITVPAAMAVTTRLDVGSITLSDTRGESDLRTNVGAINVNNVTGILRLNAGSGTIDIKNGREVTLDLRTDRGAITFAGSLGDQRHRLESDNGNVTLILPKDIALDVDLQTDRGEIKSELPLTLTADLNSRKRGTINGGGARLTITTHNGNIALMTLHP